MPDPVEPYYYFLSYARDDGDEWLSRFEKDLENAVRENTQHPAHVIGFRDRTDIEAGEVWLSKTSGAIRNCFVFVPILTQRFFTRDFCGREWAAFQQRVGANMSRTVPVLWSAKERVLSSAPPPVAAFQVDDGGYPELYAAEGLKYLYKISSLEPTKQMVVERLARRIITLAEQRPLAQALPDNVNLDQIVSAWKPPAGAPPPLPGAPTPEGPRYVQFIFAAAPKEEIRHFRTRTDSYGQLPIDWKPFLPDMADEIAVVAQEVAADHKYFSQVHPLGADLVQVVTQAGRAGNLVAIILDTWTLKLGGVYEQALSAYDGLRFPHAAVLVPWNAKDPEMATKAEELEAQLLSVLPLNAEDPRFFIHPIKDAQQFRDDLTRILASLRASVAKVRKVQKRAEGAPINRPFI
jgi:FxsC-like protein